VASVTTGRTKAAILGAGAWGTALAKVLGEKGVEVVVWTRREALCAALLEQHQNPRYLPGVALPPSVTATVDLREALEGAGLVLFVLPSHATREVARLARPYMPSDALIVSATKGIEVDSLMMMSEVLAQELPEPLRDRIAFLSGPSFANEVVAHHPTVVVVACRDDAVCHEVMRRLHTPYLRLYASTDVPGVECGGALKNVIAIATGAVEGLGYGHNTRAAVITRGLAEIARLAVACGGSPLTLSGLAGMGDLVLTCTGELSRNRTVGVELGKGRKLGEILERLGHVAEGVNTTRSAHDLARKLGVDMPIVREMYAILYEDKPITQAGTDLMARQLGPEIRPTSRSA
jgi:glycerol-3-phosphate dehydrogenase (NAD(P)+)